MNQGPDGHEHRRRIFELVGESKARLPRTLTTPKARYIPAKGKPRLPDLRPLSIGEMAAIAESRAWCSFAGLELLTRRRLLWHGMVWDDGREWPAWIITDSTRFNAQARRLDGEVWHGIGDKKAKTLPGCDPSWPIGVADLGNRPNLILCEGGPDFLAGPLVAWWEGLTLDDFAVCCVTGAGNGISPNALPLFAGKRIRIAAHADTPGRDAAERWAAQLYKAGAQEVDRFDFAGLMKSDTKPVNDLADFATCLDLEHPPTLQVFADLMTPKTCRTCLVYS
jgi:hypothetical protein